MLYMCTHICCARVHMCLSVCSPSPGWLSPFPNSTKKLNQSPAQTIRTMLHTRGTSKLSSD